VADKTRDVAKKLGELHREGKIPDSSWSSLQPAVQQLATDLPLDEDDDG
jgi:hypothetical protein